MSRDSSLRLVRGEALVESYTRLLCIALSPLCSLRVSWVNINMFLINVGLESSYTLYSSALCSASS